MIKPETPERPERPNNNINSKHPKTPKEIQTRINQIHRKAELECELLDEWLFCLTDTEIIENENLPKEIRCRDCLQEMTTHNTSFTSVKVWSCIKCLNIRKGKEQHKRVKSKEQNIQRAINKAQASGDFF